MTEERKKKEETKDEEYLTTYICHLEQKLHNLEAEKQLFDAERLDLEQELNSLREPPLVAAVVLSVEENTRKVTVLSSTGPIYIVNSSRKVRNEQLKPGMFVSLNRRTFAIMDILSITKEDVYAAKKKLIKDY